MRARLSAVVLSSLAAVVGVCIAGCSRRQLAHPTGAATLGAELKLARPEGDEDRTWPGDPAGVEISRLVDGGPGALAGLVVGDRIRALDGVPIGTPATWSDCSHRWVRAGRSFWGPLGADTKSRSS